MINDYPALGIGPGTYASVFTQYQPAGLAKQRYMANNDYLHFIAEIGLPLIIVMIWMFMALYLHIPANALLFTVLAALTAAPLLKNSGNYSGE